MICRNILCYTVVSVCVTFSLSYPDERPSRILTLDDCISLALRNNFDLKIEQETIKEADSELRQMKAQRLPQLNFEASYLRSSDVMEATIDPNLFGLPFQFTPIHLRFGDEDNYSTKLILSQPLFTGFKITNSIEALENKRQAATFNEQIQRNNLTFQVKQIFYNLLNVQKSKEVALLSLQSVDAHLKDIQNLYQQGMVEKTEVLKVEIKRCEVELMINQIDNRIELMKKSMLNVLGQDLNSDISLRAELVFDIDSMTYNRALELAFQNRPELSRLSFQQKSLTHFIKAAEGDYFPAISLIGNYEYAKPGLNKLENEWMDYWTMGIAARWSLWDWGIRKSQVERAYVALNRAEYTDRKIRQAIELDVQLTLLNKHEAEQRVRICQKSRQQAEENFRLINDQFQQGMVTNTEFLDAETQLTKSKIDEWRAIADYHNAIADLKRAMGNWKVTE